MTAPCWKCGAPAVAVLRYRDRCAQCLSGLFRRLDPSVFAPAGIMLPVGEIRPDGSAYVECASCGATDDVGTVFTACRWCCARYYRELDWAAQRVLVAPDVDRDDTTFDAVSLAWRGRLQRAVEAGIVTAEAAQRAWRRHAEGVADVAA